MAGIMFEKEATLISKAIKDNDIVGLRMALKSGADPHHKDRKGNTYLHYVCTMHRPSIIHTLVGAGIDVNARNRHGNTALHVTALHHDCSHVADLLAAGIDPTIQNKDGKVAAKIATRNKFWKSVYDKYQPGIFEAIASHDVQKVLHLFHCWSRVDSRRDGQTLRQFAASHKFHDIVFHIDMHQCTLGAIYSVLEGDLEKAWSYMSNAKCDINFLNYASESSHILQCAIKLRDSRLVNLICRSRVNVNIRVTVQGYLKAPLFFVAIDPKIPEQNLWAVLKAGADFTLKDERGRNAAIFALDKFKGKILLEIIVYMMSQGLDVSQRDETGVTLRDVARFYRRHDIVSFIDKTYIKMIRKSNLAELERLAVMGYDGMLIDCNYRDTFIYASGNETEDVLKFTQELPNFYLQVRKFHFAVGQSSLNEIEDILAKAERPDLLLNARDKGGRTALHLCILHWRAHVLKMMLSQSNIDESAVDNLGRTAYHYACALEEEDERTEICRLLEVTKIDTGALDYSDRTASFNVNNVTAALWLKREKQTTYGMEKQLSCVDKYEELCCLMRCKNKELKHFEAAICKFKYPVSKFAAILTPMMQEYRDLLFVAMDKGKEDIAVRLIQLGTDWRQNASVKEFKPENAGTRTRNLISVADYAKNLKMDKVTAAIKKKVEFFKRRQEKEIKKNDNVKNVEHKVHKLIISKVRKVARKDAAVEVGSNDDVREDDDKDDCMKDKEDDDDCVKDKVDDDDCMKDKKDDDDCMKDKKDDDDCMRDKENDDDCVRDKKDNDCRKDIEDDVCFEEEVEVYVSDDDLLVTSEECFVNNVNCNK